MLTPGPAIECDGCSVITLVSEAELLEVAECPNCGQDCPSPVRVEPCTLGSECEHDDHHFGYGVHVREVQS